MKSILHVLFCLLVTFSAASGASLKGYVYDQKTGEALVGATVSIGGIDKTVLKQVWMVRLNLNIPLQGSSN